MQSTVVGLRSSKWTIAPLNRQHNSNLARRAPSYSILKTLPWATNKSGNLPIPRRRLQAIATVSELATITTEDLTAPFLWFNTAITYAWILLIAAPRWELTKAIMKSDAIVIIPSLAFLYFFITATMIDAASPEELSQKVVFLFTEAITDPAKMATLSTPAYIAQDWIHLLVWDFVVGRFIYLDALDTIMPVRFSLLVTFSSGPPGLLVHLLTKAVIKTLRSRQDQKITKE